MKDVETVVNEKSNSYKRNTYADNAAMSRYKKEKFAGNCTAQDEYTGKTVKIHSDNEFDIANTDHIKPLKQGFEEVKYNYFVSDEQLKQALNDASNFAITNGSLNKSKRDKTNQSYIEHNSDLDELTKQKMQDLEKEANREFDRKMQKATVSTATELAKNGALCAVKSSAGKSAVKSAIQIAEGEKEIDEAITDIVCNSLKAGVDGACSDVSQVALMGGRDRIVDAIDNPMLKENIQKIFKNENMGLLVSMGANAGSLTIKALKGEISIEEYRDELIDTSVEMAIFYQLAMLAAPYGVIPGIVVNYLATKIFDAIYKWADEDRMRQIRIDNYCQIRKMAKVEGERVATILSDARNGYEKETDDALRYIEDACQTGEIGLYAKGVQSLCKCYGFEVAINSEKDMRNYLQSELSQFELGESVKVTY